MGWDVIAEIYVGAMQDEARRRAMLAEWKPLPGDRVKPVDERCSGCGARKIEQHAGRPVCAYCGGNR